jgi:hypothetical protein
MARRARSHAAASQTSSAVTIFRYLFIYFFYEISIHVCVSIKEAMRPRVVTTSETKLKIFADFEATKRESL